MTMPQFALKEDNVTNLMKEMRIRKKGWVELYLLDYLCFKIQQRLSTELLFISHLYFKFVKALDEFDQGSAI